MLATERINIRTTPHAKAVIERACQKLGVSVSGFMAQSAYEKALSLEHDFDSHAIGLNQDEWEKALAMLDDEPSEQMSALLARGYRAIGR